MPNSVGLINCLPQPGTVSQSIPTSMPLNSVPFIKSCVTGQFRLPGQHHRAAGRRSGVSFFARYLDYFIVTRNFTAIYRDLVPSRQFIVTRNFSATYRDWPARTTETNSLSGLYTRSVGRAKNEAPRRRRHLIKPPGR
jgi:hypothetical protein